jgi:anti-anti-sigma factor
MLELSVKPLKKIDVISVEGRVDSANVGELEAALKGLQERGRHKLVLDFDKLDYISSGGLRAMVASLKTARNHGGDVVIVKPNERIRDTLSLVGFQSLFVQYDDLLDAVDAF